MPFSLFKWWVDASGCMMASGKFLQVDNYDAIIFTGRPAWPHLKLLEVKKSISFCVFLTFKLECKCCNILLMWLWPTFKPCYYLPLFQLKNILFAEASYFCIMIILVSVSKIILPTQAGWTLKQKVVVWSRRLRRCVAWFPHNFYVALISDNALSLKLYMIEQFVCIHLVR